MKAHFYLTALGLWPSAVFFWAYAQGGRKSAVFNRLLKHDHVWEASLRSLPDSNPSPTVDFKRRGVAMPIVLIFAIALLLGGALLDWYWLPNTSLSAPILWINFIPGLMLLGAWCLSVWFSRWRRWFIASGILLTVIAIGVAGFLNWGAASFEEAIASVTDVARYASIVGDGSNPLTAHFPRSIPDTASEVHFYYQPAFLQGGSTLLLRCHLPSSEIEALAQKYRPAAIQVSTGLTSNADLNYFPHALTSGTAAIGYATLPADFQVLVLGASPPEQWNHGDSYGIAISTTRQEVIFWAETW